MRVTEHTTYLARLQFLIAYAKAERRLERTECVRAIVREYLSA